MSLCRLIILTLCQKKYLYRIEIQIFFLINNKSIMSDKTKINML